MLVGESGVCMNDCPKKTEDLDDVHNVDSWVCLSSVKASQKQSEVNKCIDSGDSIDLTNMGCECNFIWRTADGK